MKDYQNNAAGRLFLNLTEAKKHKPDTQIRHVWGKVFGIAVNNAPEIYYHISLLSLMADETEQKINKVSSVNKDLLLRSMPNIRDALRPLNLRAQWKESVKYLTQRALTDLEHCASTIAGHFPESPIGEDELSGIYTQIDNLFQEIEKSDVSPELKESILDLLETVRRLINEYRIRGPKTIREALVKMTGEITIRWNEIENNKDKKGVKALFELVKTLDKTHGKAIQYGPLLQYFPPVAGLLEYIK